MGESMHQVASKCWSSDATAASCGALGMLLLLLLVILVDETELL